MSRGFTLIEMLIAVALIGVISAATLPGFAGFLNGQKVNLAARNVYTAMQLTKSSAIQQNSKIALVFDSTRGSWCIFDRSIESTSTTCSGTTNTLETGVLRKYIEPMPTGLVITVLPAAANQITYDGLGRVVPNLDASATITNVAVTMPGDSSRANSVQLNNGLVRLCDPLKAVGDPQAC